MFGLGPLELGLIFLVVLVVFGPKSLPKIGQAVGKGIKEFKDAASGITTALDEDEQARKKAQEQKQQVTDTAQATSAETVSENKVHNESVS